MLCSADFLPPGALLVDLTYPFLKTNEDQTVGGGLPPMAEYQSPMNWLNHCIGGKPPPTLVLCAFKIVRQW